MSFRLVLIVLCLTGCSSRDRDVVIRPIPGTEQVALFSNCITVSPDERWLVFTEWKLPKSMVFEQLPPSEYYARLVSLDLETGARIEHTTDSLSSKALGFSSNDSRWQYHAGFRIMEKLFHPRGWRGGQFYFQRYSRSTYLALDPREPGIRIAPRPQAPGTCSDCFPVATTRFREHSWDMLSEDVSAVVRDGAIQSVYYRGPGPHKTHMIYCLPDSGDSKVMVERPLKKRTLLTIASVRVSPDERYLAYMIHSKKQAFLSGPREEVYVMDLNSGVSKKIARHSYVGNLVWSPDGDRLYYAGGEYADKKAIYIVDVAATFGHLEN